MHAVMRTSIHDNGISHCPSPIAHRVLQPLAESISKVASLLVAIEFNARGASSHLECASGAHSVLSRSDMCQLNVACLSIPNSTWARDKS